MRESYRFVVTGRVQGVFFRQSAREQAIALGLHGWVSNRADGAVEGVVTGVDPRALEQFRDWLQRGPERAQVKTLSWTAAQEPSQDGFDVRR